MWKALFLSLALTTVGCWSDDDAIDRSARYLGSSGLVISQLYPGGNTGTAAIKYDYVELFNRGTAAVVIPSNSWTLQYASANSTFWSSYILPATTIPVGKYRLYRFEVNGTTGAEMPVAQDDSSTALTFAATAGKVALVASTTELDGCSGSSTCLPPSYVDLVGYGSTATGYEGTGPAPAPGTNKKVEIRKGGGCVDTNDNAADFEQGTWSGDPATGVILHNSQSPAAPCFTDDGGTDGGQDAGPEAGQDGGQDASPEAGSDDGGDAGGADASDDAGGDGGDAGEDGFIVPPEVDLTVPLDLAEPADLAVPADLAEPPDLAVELDLAEPPDLTVALDFAEPPDLTVVVPPPDLSALPDLATPPDMAMFSYRGLVVISQVYGAGGNTGAEYRNDYVELFNRSSSPVDIGNWSIQYGSATNNFSLKVNFPADTVLQPGQYFLVQLGGGSNGIALPPADFISTAMPPINMSASNGKVALVANTTLLACGSASTRCSPSSLVDLIGYGTSADFEGTAAPTPADASQGLLRKGEGCADSDNNLADFDETLAAPRNSSSPVHLCNLGLPDGGATDAGQPADMASGGAGIVVISQLYGAGGNSGASYRNDFVELFNRGGSPVALEGWSVQYGSAANNFSSKAVIPAGVSIAPGQYVLVQLAQGTNGMTLPAPDVTATGTSAFNMSASSGKVALVSNATTLACGTATNRCSSPAIADLVGYGAAADYEGDPAGAPSSAAQSLHRRAGGCIDDDFNADDFSSANVTPRNSASPFRDCSALPVVEDMAVARDAAAPADLRAADASIGASDDSGIVLVRDLAFRDLGSAGADRGCSCDLAGRRAPGSSSAALLLGGLLLFLRRRARVRR